MRLDILAIRDAHSILDHMLREPSMHIRYSTPSRWVTNGVQTAGEHTETFALTHVADAWKKLVDAVYALPVLDTAARSTTPAPPSRDLPSMRTPRR
jgi:hypothetical protein